MNRRYEFQSVNYCIYWGTPHRCWVRFIEVPVNAQVPILRPDELHDWTIHHKRGMVTDAKDA